MRSTLLLGTRKGFIAYHTQNNYWQIENISFEGMPVSIAYADPRNSTWWACLDHGHWGVKLHRSKDRGNTWEEVVAPAYPEGEEIKDGLPAATRYIWSMAHGGKNFHSKLWVGTDPGGLFLSEDGGDSFQLVESLWKHPTRKEGWFGGGRDQPGIHSIVVDPRDENHIHVAISCAGVFETVDAGKTWEIRNKGLRADFLPDPAAETGHDPHILVAAPTNPDILWQQNHCGIFRSKDGSKSWEDVSQPQGPARFGFAIAVADDNPDQAWVAPAHSDENRTAIKGALSICRTDDGGKSWKDCRNGLPQNACFDIVYRHALANSADNVAFGTTTGNLFFSPDRGESWQVLNNYLPMIYSVQFAD
ncbi:glycosyl hydrolase [Flavitalea sp. BT771]|uniref:WD40/YVTN/BNR-like repeat-containing protein n=1 Tax=Flavitalea sp. BT771 TaxID=3063329 RepID=UPI0026E2C6FA|nr:glycosyl hydrolase [Flavitalea sp. BT771]MDO6435004.1 glycosyl hydrolase [Flavitalea sp. BT771]MDV6223904.1 glycosyl hydrolase [Flavitalea sp. BT771]